MQPDMALLTSVTIGCGPSIYNADASTVAGSQQSELETVKKQFPNQKTWPVRWSRIDGCDQ